VIPKLPCALVLGTLLLRNLIAELPPEEGVLIPHVESGEDWILSLRGQVLHAMQQGNYPKSLETYKDLKAKIGHDDLELVQQMGLMLLQQGSRSSDPEVLLLALYGTAVTGDPSFLPLFEAGILCDNPNIQMAATQLIAGFNDDRADAILSKALASPYLPIRLEAAYALARKRHTTAFGQIEALMYKVDERLRPLFPTLFAIEGSALSMANLRQMLYDNDLQVRLETILNLAENERDDFLPQIRSLANHIETTQQEACAYALGILKDEGANTILQRLVRSPHPQVQLAAHFALYQLGRKEAAEFLRERAIKEHDLFAIALLSECEGYEETLAELLQSTDRHVRLNAAIGLLRKRDSRCRQGILEILLSDSRDVSLQQIHSDGLALRAWKWSSTPALMQKTPYQYELALAYKENLLQQCVDLPQETFLYIAYTLFRAGSRSLVPLLVELLRNLQSEEAVALLQSQLERAGAPLIRGYCLLALYEIDPSGPYTERLIATVRDLRQTALIRFRALIPWKMRLQTPSAYTLTPEEQSRLFLSALIALASQKDARAIEALMETMAEGNPKNRYALAGLLIRAAE